MIDVSLGVHVNPKQMNYYNKIKLFVLLKFFSVLYLQLFSRKINKNQQSAVDYVIVNEKRTLRIVNFVV